MTFILMQHLCGFLLKPKNVLGSILSVRSTCAFLLITVNKKWNKLDVCEIRGSSIAQVHSCLFSLENDTHYTYCPTAAPPPVPSCHNSLRATALIHQPHPTYPRGGTLFSEVLNSGVICTKVSAALKSRSRFL